MGCILKIPQQEKQSGIISIDSPGKVPVAGLTDPDQKPFLRGFQPVNN